MFLLFLVVKWEKRKRDERIHSKILRPLIMDDVLNLSKNRYGKYYLVYWPYIAIALVFKFFLMALNKFFTCFIMLSFRCFCVINTFLILSVALFSESCFSLVILLFMFYNTKLRVFVCPPIHFIEKMRNDFFFLI